MSRKPKQSVKANDNLADRVASKLQAKKAEGELELRSYVWATASGSWLIKAKDYSDAWLQAIKNRMAAEIQAGTPPSDALGEATRWFNKDDELVEIDDNFNMDNIDGEIDRAGSSTLYYGEQPIPPPKQAQMVPEITKSSIYVVVNMDPQPDEDPSGVPVYASSAEEAAQKVVVTGDVNPGPPAFDWGQYIQSNTTPETLRVRDVDGNEFRVHVYGPFYS